MNDENSKLSLVECRAILGNENANYTDDELIKIHDWLDNMADIVLDIVEQNGIDNLNEILDRRAQDDIKKKKPNV